jgi:CubicO group peptidase (beta-lactamase class C family)
MRTKLLLLTLMFPLVVSCGHAATGGLDKLPGSPLGQHVRAWFEAYEAGDDAAIEAYAAAHVGDAARARTPLARRIETMRAMRKTHGALTIIQVPGDDARELAVVVKDAHGDFLELSFLAEPAPPHRLAGMRVDTSDGPGAPRDSGPPLEEAGLAEAVRGKLGPDFSGVVLVARGERTLASEARGLADRETNAKIALDTRFNIASIGKIFTRLALAQLAEAGKLALADPVTRWLPDYRVENAGKITLDQLAAHRAGVDDVLQRAHELHGTKTMASLADWMGLITDRPLLFEPGTSERYSNGGYVLLGGVIAKASGEDYYDYVQRHILDVVGMKHTGWPLQHSDEPGRAIGYSRRTPGEHQAAASKELRSMRDEWPERGSPAGGAFADAGDLLKFMRAMRASRLASVPWTQWTLGGPEPSAASPGTLPADLGFAIAGGAPGTNCVMEFAGAYDIIVLTNSDPPAAQDMARSLRGLVRRVSPS